MTFWIVHNQGVRRDEIETNLWGVKDIFDDKGLEFIIHRIKMNLANECSVDWSCFITGKNISKTPNLVDKVGRFGDVL